VSKKPAIVKWRAFSLWQTGLVFSESPNDLVLIPSVIQFTELR
jgi:hypothetical protein